MTKYADVRWEAVPCAYWLKMRDPKVANRSCSKSRKFRRENGACFPILCRMSMMCISWLYPAGISPPSITNPVRGFCDRLDGRLSITLVMVGPGPGDFILAFALAFLLTSLLPLYPATEC